MSLGPPGEEEQEGLYIELSLFVIEGMGENVNTLAEIGCFCIRLVSMDVDGAWCLCLSAGLVSLKLVKYKQVLW